MHFAALTLGSRAFGSTHNTHTVMLFKTTYSMHGGGDFWLFWGRWYSPPMLQRQHPAATHALHVASDTTVYSADI